MRAYIFWMGGIFKEVKKTHIANGNFQQILKGFFIIFRNVFLFTFFSRLRWSQQFFFLDFYDAVTLIILGVKMIVTLRKLRFLKASMIATRRTLRLLEASMIATRRTLRLLEAFMIATRRTVRLLEASIIATPKTVPVSNKMNKIQDKKHNLI